jgi:pimeloyl-ACP methyl ester carboxylesterase
MLTHDLFNSNTDLIFHDYGAPRNFPAAPVLLYLPGVQADWTPFRTIAPLLASRWRLIATCYPRQCAWSLADFGAAALRLLDKLEIDQAHVLAESFGSVVGWELTLAAQHRISSLVLAGGFCRSPKPIGARLARKAMHWVPNQILEKFVDNYVKWLGLEELESTHPLAGQPFLAVRSRQGWRAGAHRMRLIYRADYRPRLTEIKIPVGYIGGGRDWVVPVRREIATLEKLLPAACGFRSKLWENDPHPILPTRPADCAAWLGEWINEIEALNAQQIRTQATG